MSLSRLRSTRQTMNPGRDRLSLMVEISILVCGKPSSPLRAAAVQPEAAEPSPHHIVADITFCWKDAGEPPMQNTSGSLWIHLPRLTLRYVA